MALVEAKAMEVGAVRDRDSHGDAVERVARNEVWVVAIH